MNIVPSPCQRLCTVKDDHCEVCGRSLDEIAAWRLMSNDEKRAVLQRLETQGLNKGRNKDD